MGAAIGMLSAGELIVDAALAMLEVAAIGMLVVEDWTWDELWTGGSKAEKDATTIERVYGAAVMILYEAVS